jgi:hypothetical protein
MTASTVPKAKALTEDLLTIPEIAFLTGFERGTVERWRLRTRNDEPVFIEPDDYIGSTPVFRLSRVVAWCGLNGRPAKVDEWRAHRDAGGFRRRA